VTRILWGLRKRHIDFQTLHEQVNKLVYSFNCFESCFTEKWLDKHERNFFGSMRNSRIIKFYIFSIRKLMRTVLVFAERVTYTSMHIYIRTYIHTCIHTYIYAYIHTYTHAYIHTYTHNTSYKHTHTHFTENYFS